MAATMYGLSALCAILVAVASKSRSRSQGQHTDMSLDIEADRTDRIPTDIAQSKTKEHNGGSDVIVL